MKLKMLDLKGKMCGLGNIFVIAVEQYFSSAGTYSTIRNIHFLLVPLLFRHYHNPYIHSSLASFIADNGAVIISPFLHIEEMISNLVLLVFLKLISTSLTVLLFLPCRILAEMVPINIESVLRGPFITLCCF